MRHQHSDSSFHFVLSLTLKSVVENRRIEFQSRNERDRLAKNKIHTDLQPYKYIPYSDAAVLRERLLEEIEGFYGVAELRH
jgi:hypothetical protein